MQSTFANSESQDEMQHNKLHFIRLYRSTACKDKTIVRRRKRLNFGFLFLFKITTQHPRYVQLTIPSPFYQPRRKNSLVYKGLNLAKELTKKNSVYATIREGLDGGGGVWYSLFIKNLAHYSSH